MWRLIFSIGLSAFVLGCATNPTQQAALLLVDQLDSYQGQVNAKIKAEQTFYRDIRAAADAAAGRQAWVDQALAQRTAIIELADQAIVRDKGLQVTLVQTFLREQNRLAATRKQDLAARRAELEENYSTSFDALALKSQQLTIVRAQLLNLSQDRDNRALLIDTLKRAACLASVQTEAASQNEADLPADEQTDTTSTDDPRECK